MELIIIIPVVVALVEAVKKTGLASRFSPLVSIILGIAAVYFFGEGDAITRVFEGIVAGLSASGLYSGVKAQVE